MNEISFGFTPDPDDAFAYYALVKGRVAPPPGGCRFILEPIDSLNQRAACGKLDVAAVSSVCYPSLAERYAVLRSGASVGRGYGPVLAARRPVPPEEVNGMRVAVAGEMTTGGALLRLFFPGASTVRLPFEEIAEAIAGGEVEAGVLIHEELLRCPEHRLARVACLGEEWQRLTSLPLPVGLNVVRRGLGAELAAEVCRAVRESILYALEHRKEAAAWALRFGRSRPVSALRFIRMFANEDTVDLGPDVEAGLHELFRRLQAAGLAPPAGEVEFVEAATPGLPARASAAGR